MLYIFEKHRKGRGFGVLVGKNNEKTLHPLFREGYSVLSLTFKNIFNTHPFET